MRINRSAPDVFEILVRLPVNSRPVKVLQDRTVCAANSSPVIDIAPSATYVPIQARWTHLKTDQTCIYNCSNCRSCPSD
jgi:hypothetical protein